MNLEWKAPFRLNILMLLHTNLIQACIVLIEDKLLNKKVKNQYKWIVVRGFLALTLKIWVYLFIKDRFN
jgi:hypothetical protein